MEGLGFRGLGLGGLGFRVQGLGFGCRVEGFLKGVSAFRTAEQNSRPPHRVEGF